MDKDAKTVARYTYDAWGACTIIQDSSDCNIANINPYRYRSYYYDAEISMYYLQSRYYDATLGRFVNGDDVSFLGSGSSVMSYDLFTYCENDCINFVDYYGHAPSLITLTSMHNAVIRSALAFLFSVGTIAVSEVRTWGSGSKKVGRMDIYSYLSNRVWEVKRNNAAGIRAGERQLNQYTSSYVYSLYHSWIRIRRKPTRGNINVYGAVVVSGYLVTYRSYALNSALILYDYMSLENAAKLLFSALTATSAVLSEKLTRYSTKLKKKFYEAVAAIRKFLGSAWKFTKEFAKQVGNLLKYALPFILACVAIVIFMYTGVPLFA